MNRKNPEDLKIKKLIGFDPDVHEYVESWAPAFQKGKAGGFTEAVNRLIRFAKECYVEDEKDG